MRHAHRHPGIRPDGWALGTLFARAGHDVVFSYARSERKLKRLARDAKGTARAGTPAEAAITGRSQRALAHCTIMTPASTSSPPATAVAVIGSRNSSAAAASVTSGSR